MLCVLYLIFARDMISRVKYREIAVCLCYFVHFVPRNDIYLLFIVDRIEYLFVVRRYYNRALQFPTLVSGSDSLR